tara:strand:+ start:328 stop:663 length:336 start_codon:yes stop_codon:yes gene_type:complete
MKTLIKFIYTVLLPLGMITFTAHVLLYTENGTMSKLILIILTLFTVLQSFFWFVFLDKIKMIPRVNTEFFYGLGLAVGFRNRQAFITVPFVVLTFDWRSRIKKEDNYGYYF